MTVTRVWKQRALDFFVQAHQRVFTRQQLAALLASQSESFGTPPTLTLHRFINTLITSGQLREVRVTPALPATPAQPPNEQTAASENKDWAEGKDDRKGYRPFPRFVWGEASPYEVALSLRPRSYLSHASAVFLHGLTRQIVRTVYANQEQSPKPPPSGRLAQERIDYAFRAPVRTSQYVFLYEGTRLMLLNGTNTGNLEVTEMAGPGDVVYSTTKLERTLIDITVRPTYAGGVFEVLEAFRGARERASVATLLATLKRLDYVYPYQQALGFYMERAGYSGMALERIAASRTEFSFYLTHQMSNPKFDARWRIYYPDGL